MNYKLLTIHYKLFLLFCTVMLTSCNLFIDEDLERQLLQYSGKGYDKVVSEQTEGYSIDYQYKRTTLELNADNPLTQHIVRVENIDSARCHIIYFDSTVSPDELPRVGQCIVSNNTALSPCGLCDLVGIVEKVNGETVLTCKGVDPQDAYEKLEFHASFPADEYIDEYDLYDENHNFLCHVDNRENNAREAQTRGDDDGEPSLNFEIPYDIPFKSSALKEKLYSNNIQLAMTGGAKYKIYANFDYSFRDGLKASVHEVSTDQLGIKISVLTGMTKPFPLWGSDDLLKGKVKLTVGPVVVIPVLGVNFSFQASARVSTEISYTKKTDCEVGLNYYDFYSKDFLKEGESSTVKASFSSAGNIDLLVVKMSIGFGLYSSELTARMETYAKAALNINGPTISETYHPLGTDQSTTTIDSHPKVSLNIQVGFALALVAKGMVVSKILEKIQKHISETSTLYENVEKFANGDYGNWVDYKNGNVKNIFPNVLTEMEKELAGLDGDKRKEAIDAMIKKKSKENSGMKLSDDWFYTAQNKKFLRPDEVVKDEKGKDKEFSLRLGPYYPEMLKWTPYEKPLFPQMREGSFRMGRNWDANKEKLIFTAEYVLEDPGIFSAFQDYYPGFVVKLGNEAILYEMANDGEKLTYSTPSGKKFTASFPGLAPTRSIPVCPASPPLRKECRKSGTRGSPSRPRHPASASST